MPNCILPCASSLAPSGQLINMVARSHKYWTTSSAMQSCHRQVDSASWMSPWLAIIWSRLSPSSTSLGIAQTTVEGLADNWCHKSVEGRLSVGYGGQFHFSGRPHNLTSRFWSSPASVVADERWWFYWRFAHLTAPVVTITSIILSSNKIRLTQIHRENGRKNGDRDGLAHVSMSCFSHNNEHRRICQQCCHWLLASVLNQCVWFLFMYWLENRNISHFFLPVVQDKMVVLHVLPGWKRIHYWIFTLLQAGRVRYRASWHQYGWYADKHCV